MNEIPDSSSEVTEEKNDTSPDLEHGPLAIKGGVIGCCGLGGQHGAGEEADDKDKNNNNNKNDNDNKSANSQNPNSSTATGSGKEEFM
jgi:hypothetical protein